MSVSVKSRRPFRLSLPKWRGFRSRAKKERIARISRFLNSFNDYVKLNEIDI